MVQSWAHPWLRIFLVVGVLAGPLATTGCGSPSVLNLVTTAISSADAVGTLFKHALHESEEFSDKDAGSQVPDRVSHRDKTTPNSNPHGS